MLGLNKTIGGLMLGAGLLLGGTAQAADNYPSKPVHILVPERIRLDPNTHASPALYIRSAALVL